MIRRFFGYLSQEVRGLHAAAYVLAGAALLSSLLALARDRLLAHTFGAGAELDVYYAAFRIPDLIFIATAALVSVYVLIPELARRSEDEQRRYIDTVLAAFSLFAVLVAGLAALCAPVLLKQLFPVLMRTDASELVLLTRILLLQPILLGLSNILAAVTQSRGRYTLYAMSPLLYNAGIIAGVVFLYPRFGMQGLAWGVVAGALLHAAIQLPSVWRDGFLRHLPHVWDMASVRSTAFVSLPRALTLSMTQLGFLQLLALASMLGSGSIAVFVFAYNLQAVPLAIIGASYSVAAFPTLAAALSNGEREHFLDQVALAARYVFFWSMPIIALIVVLRAYLVRVVLGTGAFDWTDTRLTAAVFALLSLSLVAQGLMLLLVRAYYAAGKTLMPLIVATATAVGMIVLAFDILESFKNPLLFWATEALLRVQEVPGSRVLALAIAFSIATSAGCIALVWHFEHTYRGFVGRVQRTFLESVCAALVAGAAAYAALLFLGPLDVGSTTGSAFFKGFAGGVVGSIVAGLAYALLGSREFGELVATVRSRMPAPAFLGRARITVASSAEDQSQTQ